MTEILAIALTAVIGLLIFSVRKEIKEEQETRRKINEALRNKWKSGTVL